MAKVNSPLAQVKEKFETKEKLVDEIVSLLKPPRGEKEELRERLNVQSNSNLLRLHENAKHIQEKFGSKEKLVERINTLMGHAKDEDHEERLLEYSPGKLIDKFKSLEKKSAETA